MTGIALAMRVHEALLTRSRKSGLDSGMEISERGEDFLDQITTAKCEPSRGRH